MYRFPKFKKWQPVLSPDGDGEVYETKLIDGHHWYRLYGWQPWYREEELKPLEQYEKPTRQSDTHPKRKPPSEGGDLG